MFPKAAFVLQLICVGTLVSYCRGAAKCGTALDAIFLLDASTSVGQENFQKELTWAADLTDQFELAQNGSASGSTPAGARFGALVYSRSVAPVFDLWTHDNPGALRKACLKAPYLGESTHTHAALHAVFDDNVFHASKGGRQEAPDVVILFSDGKATYNQDAQLLAARLRYHGVTIIAVGLTPDVTLWSLRQITDNEENVFTVKDGSLEEITSRLTNKLCQGLPSTTA